MAHMKALSVDPIFVERQDTHLQQNMAHKLGAHIAPLSFVSSRLSQIFTILVAIALSPVASAAYINFDNCLSSAIVNSHDPQQLQFVPLFLDAKFDQENAKHTLNVTVYGNVTGQAVYGDYPPPNSPRWNDSSDPFGKIVDSSANYTTLFTTFQVLSYTPYAAAPSRFCNSTVGGDCPWGPLFFANASSPRQLHAFQVSHDMDSTYAFTTISPTLQIRSGDAAGQFLACVTAPITPYIGDAIAAALRYLPLVILIFVGIATVSAARLSPWSSSDFFYWSSNYGRDEDVLRLVTPGFGDCLQYIQFIVLAGSLSLDYPGYFQPVVNRVAWSALMFNQSFVSQGPGYQPVVDGIYDTQGNYGITRMSQLSGMTSNQDVWAGMAVWLCVILAIVVVACEVGFGISWAAKRLSNTPLEDLRSKNLPFTAGNVVRIVFNYFLLPVISFTMFQLVLAPVALAGITAAAVIGLVILVLFAAWVFFFIFTTKPKVHLFDNLPFLLFYGPLYNTYSDEAAPFAFIPALLTLFRGIAIGAVQPSGIAQLVILAICEVIFILTLHAFRPFRSFTSMNAYHTFFAVVRLITIFLSIAFTPSLGVVEGTKGWVGYVILLLHAIVLVFGFFMNSIQTMIEVFARRAGAGNSETRGGLTKVFGVRQLSKRVKNAPTRASLGSDAAILGRDADMQSISIAPSRSRSMSANSRMLLDEGRSVARSKRASSMFDQMSQADLSHFAPSGPSTPGGGGPMSPLSFIGRQRSIGAAKGMEPPDPYYRAPRARRPTLEALVAEHEGEDHEHESYGALQLGGGAVAEYEPMPRTRNSIVASYTRHFRDESDPTALNDGRDTTDYATRESDFYYGLRGPALSAMPSRRRKTGPADPMSPVASATGWFKGLFAGRSKEKGKGFEVVRSTPLHMIPVEEEDDVEAQRAAQPYIDSAEDNGTEKDAPLESEVGEGEEEANATSGAIRRSESMHSRLDVLIDEENPFDKSILSLKRNRIGPASSVGSTRTVSRQPNHDDYPSLPDPIASPPPTRLPRRSSKRFSRENPPPIPLASKPRLADNRHSSFRRTVELTAAEAADARVPFTSDPDGASRHGERTRTMDEEDAIMRQPNAAFMVESRTSADGRPLSQLSGVSTGRVVKHTASESIHTPTLEERRMMGSSAEIHESPI